MCHAFSCLVMRDGKVIWEAGIDSHDDLEEKYKVRDTGKASEPLRFARVEIVPNNRKKYPYLYPELKWKLNIDENVKPDWWNDELAQKAQEAFEQWKSQVYQFKYQEARNPPNPLGRKRKPNSNDIQLLKQWASVWDSVGYFVRASVWDSAWASVRASVWDSVGYFVRASVWDSVGYFVRASVWDSVWASVRASVGAKTSDYFSNIKHEIGVNPFQSGIDLWDRGLVPSFDGKTWRLHSGKKAEIVFKISKEDLSEKSK